MSTVQVCHGITEMRLYPTNLFFFCISFPLFSVCLPIFCYTSHLSILPLSFLPSLFRCNVQDYIWHKGARCEAVVTEFQVMCLAVGASALVVLLLFMIVVCFAKKLHVLKTENKKLRKRRWGRISNNEFKELEVLHFLLIPLWNGWCKLLKCMKKTGYLVF